MGLLDEFKRELPVKLTQDELDKKGVRIAKVVKDIEKLEGEKKAAVAEFNEKIEKLEKERDAIAKQLGDKAENRLVEVKWVCDAAHARKELVRIDTDETVEKQTMSAGEIAEATQGKLPLKKSKEEDPGKN